MKGGILFRTNGGKGPGLGFGHVIRTINLAKQFRKNQVFFLIDNNQSVKKILIEYGFKNIVTIKKEISQKEEILRTKKIIQELNINTIVIDKFGIQKRYTQNLKKFCNVVVITDLNNFDIPADLLINGFIGFENKIIVNKYGTKCFLGPKYQIINKNFTKQNQIKNKKFDIITSFGGADEKKISEILSDVIIEFLPNLKIKIILGITNKKSNKLQQLKKKFPNNIQIINHAKNMAKEIQEAKFGICTGGITTYEYASKNLPFAIICAEKHQIITAKVWQKNKLAFNLGLVNKNSKKDIKHMLKKFLKNDIKYRPKKNFIDGLASKRIYNEIFKIS